MKLRWSMPHDTKAFSSNHKGRWIRGEPSKSSWAFTLGSLHKLLLKSRQIAVTSSIAVVCTQPIKQLEWRFQLFDGVCHSIFSRHSGFHSGNRFSELISDEASICVSNSSCFVILQKFNNKRCWGNWSGPSNCAYAMLKGKLWPPQYSRNSRIFRKFLANFMMMNIARISITKVASQ